MEKIKVYISNFISENSIKLKSLLIASLIVYATIPFFGIDNPLEQFVEWVINCMTGLSLDFTPKLFSFLIHSIF